MAVLEMDLYNILQDLQIKVGDEDRDLTSCNHPPALPVSHVLSQIEESIRGLASQSDRQENVLLNVKQLFEFGNAHWLFADCCGNSGADVVELYSGFLDSLTGVASLPLCETDSGDLLESAYADIPKKANAVCAVLQALMSRLGTAAEPLQSHGTCNPAKALVVALGPPVCVFAVMHLQDLPWTNECSRKAASQLLDTLVQASGSVTLTDYLCGNSSDQARAFGAILGILKPKLQKDSWKRNQATKHVFSWLLTQVSRPWLADYLESVFPPSLLISDDYRSENKVLGVHCLHHIVMNVPAADLRQYNRAQVLYRALFNHLYTPEAELIEVVLPCLLDLLSVLENPCGSASIPRKSSCHDEVLRLMLTHMEMESKLALRRVYAHNLTLYVHRMGIVTVRHLKRLERVIVGYLEVSDAPGEQSRLSILDALKEVLRSAWPRIQCRLAALVRALLRMMCDVSAAADLCPSPVRNQLLDKATQCLLLLDHCCDGRVRVLFRDVDSSYTHPAVFECIEKVKNSS